MSPIYVSDCPYDPRFLCHAGCKDIDDRPYWCVHRQDLYEKALNESESEKQERLEKRRSRDQARNAFFSSSGKTAVDLYDQIDLPCITRSSVHGFSFESLLEES